MHSFDQETNAQLNQGGAEVLLPGINRVCSASCLAEGRRRRLWVSLSGRGDGRTNTNSSAAQVSPRGLTSPAPSPQLVEGRRGGGGGAEWPHYATQVYTEILTTRSMYSASYALLLVDIIMWLCAGKNATINKNIRPSRHGVLQCEERL